MCVPKRLSPSAVRALRVRYAQGGITAKALALEQGLSTQTVLRILKGKSYSDAGGPIQAGNLNVARKQATQETVAPATVEQPTPTVQPSLFEQVINALDAEPGRSGAHYARVLGKDKVAVTQALRVAEDLGYVYRTGKGRSTRWWLG